MSALSRQCVECATVFDWAGRGRPPSRCAKCKADESERIAERAGRRRGVRKASARVIPLVAPSAPASVDYAAVMASLRGEIEKLELAIALRRQALAALEV